MYKTILALALALASQIAPAQAQSFHSVEGSWNLAVTITNPPIGTLTSLITLIPGGGVVEGRGFYVPRHPAGVLTGSTGHGEWRRSRMNEINVKFVILLQKAPPDLTGAPVAVQTVRLKLTLSHDGKELDGPVDVVAVDLGGNTILHAVGTVKGTRILVD